MLNKLPRTAHFILKEPGFEPVILKPMLFVAPLCLWAGFINSVSQFLNK